MAISSNILSLRNTIEDTLVNLSFPQDPKGLYEPIKYILGLGGKRTRPLLTLLSAQLFNSNYNDAIKTAIALEVFHNFTLMHDDIMDNAPLRRGAETVHVRWDLNTAILSGDVMLVKAYDLLAENKIDCLPDVLKVFNDVAAKVCEGQQFDIDFSGDMNVAIDDYLKMIEFKTAVLIGASFQLGAIIGGAIKEDTRNIYEFGKNIGIAFQLQDDVLDVYGSPEKVGKQVGGDIIESKMTFLFLKALDLSDETKKTQLIELFTAKEIDEDKKVVEVLSIYNDIGILKSCNEKINMYYNKAFEYMDRISVSKESKSEIIDFVYSLKIRDM